MLHKAGYTSHHVTMTSQEDVDLKDFLRAFQLQDVRRTLEK